jgi:aspartate-semialdehyde dehydrogenase
LADTIAVVGSETLMGRELRDLLSANSFGADVRLVATAEEPGGVLSLQGGEPAIVLQLDQVALADADLLLLAGDPASTRSALDLAHGTPAIDLTYASEDDPRSRLRAPMTESHNFRVAPDAIQSIAHPAAIALALLLQRLDSQDQFKVERWVVHVFEPASERGAAGIRELQEQTVSLLSFKPMPKKVFDSQLSYSLLAQLGEEATVQLEHLESRIERHLATLLQNSGIGPMPSIRLIQAPVFHGYSFSVWMEFSGAMPDQSALEALLATENIHVHRGAVEPPNNVGIAGHEGISVGAILRDRNDAKAFWLWMAADNLRLAAQNALLVAQEVL